MTKYKPKEGETFYTIDFTLWRVQTYFWSGARLSTFWRDECYKSGNCFKTKKEAQEILSKIKKLLKK